MNTRFYEPLSLLSSEFYCCVSITLVLRDRNPSTATEQRSPYPAMGVCAVGAQSTAFRARKQGSEARLGCDRLIKGLHVACGMWPTLNANAPPMPTTDQYCNGCASPSTSRPGCQGAGLAPWLISTRFWRASRPIGVTVWVAPVYLVSGGAPHLDGSSKTVMHRARSRFEVGLSGPHSETLDAQRMADFDEVSARGPFTSAN